MEHGVAVELLLLVQQHQVEDLRFVRPLRHLRQQFAPVERDHRHPVILPVPHRMHQAGLVRQFLGKHRFAVLFFHTDDDVSAAHIVDVVGEGADRVDDRLRIESGFVFDPRGLYGTMIDEIIDINRDSHLVCLLSRSDFSV